MNNKKTAIVWGITGQIASYLVEEMLAKDYKVYGIKRRSSTNTMWRIQHLLNNPDFEVLEGDITDPSNVNNLTGKIKPYCIINTAAQSHVHTSFEQPAYTFTVNATGVLYILESIRNLSQSTRFLQFATSESFGSNYNTDEQGKYQDENTVMAPNSPYAVAKVAAYNLTRLYRRSYDIFSCNNINFNTESPRRGEEFVTRKITQWIGKFKKWYNPMFEQGLQEFEALCIQLESKDRIFNSNLDKIGFQKLHLGNINAYRDWSHAKDIAKGVLLAVESDKPDDYVFASGQTQTVADFCQAAFAHIGISNWQDYIYIDPTLYRPCEVEYLCGRADKAKRVLGWEPKISFEELVKEMVEEDIKREQQ